ncbi:MAG TPA: selenocysteine-specific translation elongation factor [Ktedonobacterales bacterium]|nr:selenocysteine-specific translation elongation factor [Ktedonobacterales bacterium]
MSCIGTAGHVDHGKSTLVTALTGMDPDRLAEEKVRGMTIDLGFAWLTLPSGREASVVDVPGHESFIKNMLAGVGGIDVALLVVAADEGIMPQTEEHLSILELLRVSSGVVALTKCDLVDDEWLELVREDVAKRLAPSTLAHAPIVACSAVSGAGLPELRAALDAALDDAPSRPDLGRPRLPVDRVFTIAGFGTVVTGTLQDGRLRLGQETQLMPSGRRARIRGMQSHKQPIEVASPGGRLAVNLAGVAKSDVQRGDVLALPGATRGTVALDVRLEALAGLERPLAHNMSVDVYLAAAETPARVILLEDDELRAGESGWAQLRLARPLVAMRGDRFIVRVPSPSATIGGGLVVEAHARRHRRRDTAVVARLETLARGDPEHLILAALQPRTDGPAKSRAGFGGRERAELASGLSLTPDETRAALETLTERGAVVSTGDHYYAASQWDRLREESRRTLGAYHQQYPLRVGMPKEEWRSRLGLGPREAAEVASALARSGELDEGDTGDSEEARRQRRGGLLHLPGHQPRLTPQQDAAAARMLERLRAEPFTPPSRAEIEVELGADVVGALLERGALVRVTDTILLEAGAYVEARRRIVAYLREHGRVTVAEGRDLLGASRKYMLAIFEHLDERRVTRRVGDDRVLGVEARAGGADADAAGESAEGR